MNRFRHIPKASAATAIGAAIILFIVFIFSHGAHAAYPEHVPGELLVKYKESAAAGISSLHTQAGAVKVRSFTGIRTEQIKLPPGMSVGQAVAWYSSSPDVEYAEPNYIVHAAAVPDDPRFSDQWGLNNTGQTGGKNDADIDAPEAWEISTGSASVIVAVIDAGVAINHPDLSGNIWINQGEDYPACNDGIDNDANGYIDDCNGWDFLDNDNDPTDYNSHGTHVAGIIAATGNNATGVTGVMWSARIMPIRFLGVSGSGNIADAVSAILYANKMGAHVINNSWGGGGFSQTLKDAIAAASAVVVCAAGNDGTSNESSPFYPASFTGSNIIAVAATDNQDILADFSNFGPTSVDVAAPGKSILSSVPQFSSLPPVAAFQEGFDSATGPLPLSGWDRGGSNSTWEITGGTGITGNPGDNALEDSPSGDYLPATNSFAWYTIPVQITRDSTYSISFKWKGVIDQSGTDTLNILYSGSPLSWLILNSAPIQGSNASYISRSEALPGDFLDLTNPFYIGFGMQTDSSTNAAGVFIDDVRIIRTPLSVSSYMYSLKEGTSMAAPFVSGIAGLIKAIRPGLSAAEIINAIINSVDSLMLLSGKVASGGRVNAEKALTLANSLPTQASASGGGGGGGGCFIATAAYGSYLHPHVQALRNFRDRYLLTNSVGRKIVALYYKYSPPIAGVITHNALLRFIIRLALFPLVAAVIHPLIMAFLLLSAAAGLVFLRRR